MTPKCIADRHSLNEPLQEKAFMKGVKRTIPMLAEP